MPDWKIKPGYIERPMPEYCLDRPDGNLWQWDVYAKARELAIETGAKWFIDLGCGSGEKSDMLVDGATKRYIGFDTGSNFEYCRSLPRRLRSEWRECDLESPEFAIPSEDAVIICADVIEHLINPAALLRRLADLIARVKGIILSTPDRDLTHGIDHNGPPPNVGHVREWNLSEFRELLESFGLKPAMSHVPCRKGDDRRITTMAVIA
jgi:SAM-dependent methyltransferase